MASSVAVGTPCGACKFLRRKCAPECVFAPFFCPDQGPERFAAVHKVFGASNVTKLLLHVPVHDRGDTVLTVEYEAQARLQDPVNGCVAHIQALQEQVAGLQARVMQLKAQLAAHNNMIQGDKLEGQLWMTRASSTSSLISEMPTFLGNHFGTCCFKNSSISPQSSIESIASIDEDNINTISMHGLEESQESSAKRQKPSGYSQYEWSELQELALRIMMKD